MRKALGPKFQLEETGLQLQETGLQVEETG